MKGFLTMQELLYRVKKEIPFFVHLVKHKYLIEKNKFLDFYLLIFLIIVKSLSVYKNFPYDPEKTFSPVVLHPEIKAKINIRKIKLTLFI